ncbi:agmatinase [Thiovibrio frasassiensis]|uniref:Agmatinase n=1 Tax=Thiovibrio frasassiensis TaxID=2984131 RepID=A0A9X4MHU9_9BACT|nr:agmatinase [Thiovibrio frasassiensis]MDG4476621.1 agmatinase [Thiovibrio frasassiensis]
MTHVSQFLGEEADLGPEKRITILSAPLASSVSWLGGTERGPQAIIDASPALEVFDDELLLETVRLGIGTRPVPDFSALSTAEACRQIEQSVAGELAKGMFPVLLGGEHTVTVPAVQACLAQYPDLHVVQIDAHLDLRQEYEGNENSHACVMRRLDDLGIPFTQIGIRSFSKEEYELVRSRGLQPFFMSRIHAEQDWIEQVCREIKGPVYLTCDVDGLDPAIMPGTGTPEPDGLTWRQTIDLLRGIASNHRIVGMDFVEFSPHPGAEHAAFTVAKLIYRTLGYIFR